MSIRLATVGLDTSHGDWADALRAVAEAGRIEIVGAGHRTPALARDAADRLGVPPFDDLRKLLTDARPQVIVLDRPEKLALDFVLLCLHTGIGILSLGPPVNSVAEALQVEAELTPRSALLYVWPRLVSTAAYAHCAQADEYVRPLRFIAAQWYAPSAALAKAAGQGGESVRSLSVLAWDVLATLLDLAGLPETVYASIRGRVGTGDSFADVSGSAALTLRFADELTAGVSLSDRLMPWRRELLLLGQNGTLELDEQAYRFRDAEGKLIDEGRTAGSSGAARARAALEEFLEQFAAPASPHRGWLQRLAATAATMEAMVVSQRTGQPEMPGRFLSLRR